MKKKVLILEDDILIGMNIEESLVRIANECRVIVELTDSIYAADEKLASMQKGNDDLRCVTVDLNLNPSGLSSTQKKRSNLAILTGWVWVKDSILDNDYWDNVHIIIFSGFINEVVSCKEYTAFRNKKRISLVKKDEDGLAELKRIIRRHV